MIILPSVIVLTVTFLLVVAAVATPVSVQTLPEQSLTDSYYDFVPNLVAKFKPTFDFAEIFSWKARCFRSNNATFKLVPNEKAAIIQVNSKDPKSLLCHDTYLIVSQRGVHFKDIFRHGAHQWKLFFSPEEYNDVAQFGLFVFSFDSSFKETVQDLYHTIRLFVGKGTDVENLKFITSALNITLIPREIPFSAFDPSIIRPGDVIIQGGLSGLGTMISFGTGAFASHCAIALEINGEIFIAESTDHAPFSDLKPSEDLRRGFTATKLEKWYREESMSKWGASILLPLSDENSKKFNNTAAVEWFKKNEGTPYGMRNFVFSWLDGYDNYPGKFNWQMLLTFLSLGDTLYHDKIDAIFMEGIRHRLGDYSLSSIADVLNVLDKRGDLNFAELMAIPEKEEWTYGGQNVLICSSFVVKVLKEAGIFDANIKDGILPAEFSPKDLAQLNIYKSDWTNKPWFCGQGNSSVCQILGQYHFPSIPYLNSILPYAGMNTKCGLIRTPEERC
ncbi:hypothetical protein RCL1_002456 [Eukaryota sp. TZLM3-RCL]